MYFDLLGHEPTRRRRFARRLSLDVAVRRWKESRAGILTVIAGVAFVLGVIGFAQAYPRDRPLDSLYRAVQLYGFGGNVDNRPNVWLETARFLAPLVVGYAAIGVVIGLYRDQFRWFRIRGLRNHVVIAGLGDAGSMMAASFDRDSWPVVVIERDASNPRIQGARERGIWVAQGDATDPHILRRAGVRHAALLVIMCGSDGTNVDVATAARLACSDRRDGILTAVVELHDFELWQIMKAQALVDRDHSAFRLELFNIRGLAAEMLLDEHPPFAPEQARAPHVVMVGMDGIGVSLVVEILKRWQAMPPSEHRLRLTIAGQASDAQLAALRACYAEISSIPRLDLATWRGDAATLGPLPHVPVDVSAVYVCLESETQGLAAALSLRQHPGLWEKVPIVVAVSDQRAGVGAAVRRGGRALDHVTAFGVLSRTLTPDALLHTATEVIAKYGHEYYRREQSARGQAADSERSLVPWEQLSPDLRESNRLWADGIAAHLADLRLAVVPAPLMSPDEPVFEFTGDDVERLAPLEHRRWEHAMKRLGYRQGSTRTNRTHPLIDVPFDELPDENKEKDRAHVRAIPAILAEAGFRITRLGSAHDGHADAAETRQSRAPAAVGPS
jgi:hypothetical protein